MTWQGALVAASGTPSARRSGVEHEHGSRLDGSSFHANRYVDEDDRDRRLARLVAAGDTDMTATARSRIPPTATASSPGFRSGPTPAGAFRAVARPLLDPVGRMLLNILREPVTPVLDEHAVCGWVGTGDLDSALRVLAAAQDEGLIEGIDAPETAPEGSLDVLVPLLLETLSDRGEVLLSDTDGLPLWSHGFSNDLVVRLAAMSGDVASLNERHAATLAAAVGEDAGAWALVDGIGASRLGCWPLHIGSQRFVLVVLGLPRMHHPSFTKLVWLLTRRYG